MYLLLEIVFKSLFHCFSDATEDPERRPVMAWENYYNTGVCVCVCVCVCFKYNQLLKRQSESVNSRADIWKLQHQRKVEERRK